MSGTTTLLDEKLDEILCKVLFVGHDNGRPNERSRKVINEAKASIKQLISEEGNNGFWI